MKISRKTFILIGMILAGAALYLYTNAGYAALLVILFLCLLGGAALVTGLAGDVVGARIRTPMQGEYGYKANADLTVSNPGRLPVVKCRAKVRAKNMLNEAEDVFYPDFSMWPHRDSSTAFALKDDHCGLLRVTVEEAVITDPLGIFTKKVKFEKGSELVSDMYYLPKVTELGFSPEEMSTYDMESYKYSQTQKGNDPSEMFDIKAYGEGDSFKSIHWKLSSKLDDIMVREHGLPIENRVLIIVDKRPAAADRDHIDREMEFVASLSYTMLRKGIYHSVGWYDYLNEEFAVVRVDSEDALWLGVTALIASPFRDDEMSTAQRFAESDAEKDFSNYIYISESGDGAEILTGYGQTDIYGPEDFK